MRRSIMEHSFAQNPDIKVPRSTFDRSHRCLTSFDADWLVPIYIDEVVPGDTFNCELNFLARLSTPSFPIMANLYLDTFFFFVPYRILWTNWKKFMGEQINPGDSISYSVPEVTLNTDLTAAHGCLADYLQIPMIDYNTHNYYCAAWSYRAYFKIWDDWFRDENLQDSAYEDYCTYGDGPDGGNFMNNAPLKRGKRHDYFTSCLTSMQKGDPVTIPMSGNAPITGIGSSQQAYAPTNSTTYETDGTASTSYANYIQSAVVNFHMEEDPNNSGYPNIRADLSGVTAATINELRQAFQVQKFLEVCNRAGTRYTEIIEGIYGVANAGGDARLQRPEYLGGGSTPINIHPVAVTADTGNFEAGELSAVGVGYGKHSFIKSFTEHGLVMGLANVRADIEYQCEGFERWMHRSTRYDFWAPQFNHLGEMAVLNQEIYIDDTTLTNNTFDDVFGYQMQWDDMRYKTSKITGLFRSNAASSLDAFHLAEEFGSTPVLNSTFIQSNASEGLDRTLQTPTEPHIFFDGYFNLKCTRPLPVYSVPGFIDHF